MNFHQMQGSLCCEPIFERCVRGAMNEPRGHNGASAAALEGLLAVARLRRATSWLSGVAPAGDGRRIGRLATWSGGAILDGSFRSCERGSTLAVQCCEHLNRALVVERSARKVSRLVTVVPHPKAGGALAATAMKRFSDPPWRDHRGTQA